MRRIPSPTPRRASITPAPSKRHPMPRKRCDSPRRSGTKAAGSDPVLLWGTAPVACGFRPQPGLPSRGRRARSTCARGVLVRHGCLLYRPRQHGEGGVRGGAAVVSAAQRLCACSRRQGLDGPGSKHHRRGPSRALRPRRSDSALSGRRRGGTAGLSLARAARPLAIEGRPGSPPAR
jgi:hypothetical protein